ncbi:DNA-3-methyladenine glycosylase 2 [Allonocardiopsis opalescens]|uniref:DNA-3-methyladenine glycosylase II n=1 Tax=Allonocardiopsis opalescens TaxID=1144618 RepID=A0A2T0Q9N3_9ACTN|nr:DNA-3-methyladenine glycosylase 2 [Allonocardiopsis opalescens]PRY00511.1 DNA-3-methyladenine glycosylase II [Allonocardiopsis opalescens]
MDIATAAEPSAATAAATPGGTRGNGQEHLLRDLDFDTCYRAIVARDARFDGRFYIGVTSTGIYCRPICPSRTPARRNVRFYPHAAAAEVAGFRACRRCRPETSPGSPDWDVRKDLIGRALRLIENGTVDAEGVGGLAGRLAVTERHLHRLFIAEVGAGPLALARTRRLQLARRLLAESDLPITDIAFASGFGSVRRFNESVKDAYGLPPGALRGHRTGRPLRAAQPGGPLSLRLAYRPPFDAAALLDFLAARAIPGVEEVSPNRYARTIATPGGPGTLELLPDPGAPQIVLRLAVPDLRGTPQVVAACRALFDLCADPATVAGVLGADPALAPLVAARPGLRVPGAYDGFELAVRAVLGQQVSVAAARTLAGRLVAATGTPLPEPVGTLTHVFPTADALAGADLDHVGLTGARRRTLRALAEAVADGGLHLDSGADVAATTAALEELPGIGPWTSGYIAMRALRDPDAFPGTDLVLRRAMESAGITTTEPWRPWRAYAALHLWTAPPEQIQRIPQHHQTGKTS